MESAAAVANQSDIDIDYKDPIIIDIVHAHVVCAGMRDISKGAVGRLLETLDDEDIEHDKDVRASFAYVLAKEKIGNYELQAEKFFEIVMGDSMESRLDTILNS